MTNPVVTRRAATGYVVTMGERRATIAADPLTAHALYTAQQLAFGMAAGGSPYPVRAWDALPDASRERWLRCAAVYAVLGHLDPAERVYTACQTDLTVKRWNDPSLKLRGIWERMSALLAALDAGQEAA
jgi:hypothetical protein